MALSNEQYDALMREYNHKQSRNNQIVSYRSKTELIEHIGYTIFSLHNGCVS